MEMLTDADLLALVAAAEKLSNQNWLRALMELQGARFQLTAASVDARLGRALRRCLDVRGPDCICVTEKTEGSYRAISSGPHPYGDDNHAGALTDTPAEALEALADKLGAAGSDQPFTMTAVLGQVTLTPDDFLAAGTMPEVSEGADGKPVYRWEFKREQGAAPPQPDASGGERRAQ